MIARLGVGANVQAHAAAAQAGPAVGVPVGQIPPAAQAAPQAQVPPMQAPPAAQAAPQAQVPPMAQAAPQAQPQLAADAPRLANIMQPRVFPWTGTGDYSIMDQLCAQLSPAEATNMERWDQLVRALSVSDPPGYPFQPPDEVMARVDYCNTRISDLQAQHDIRLPPTNAPGWLAVFSAVRTLMRPTTSGGSAVIPVPVGHQNSFGSRAQRNSVERSKSIASNTAAARPMSRFSRLQVRICSSHSSKKFFGVVVSESFHANESTWRVD